MIFIAFILFLFSNSNAERLVQINRDSQNITPVDPFVFLGPNFTKAVSFNLVSQSAINAMNTGFSHGRITVEILTSNLEL